MEELLVESKNDQNAEDWSRDGRSIVYNELVAGNSRDLGTLSLEARKTQAFLATMGLSPKVSQWLFLFSISRGFRAAQSPTGGAVLSLSLRPDTRRHAILQAPRHREHRAIETPVGIN